MNPYLNAGLTDIQEYTQYRFGILYDYTGVYNILASDSADISSYVKYTIQSLSSANNISWDITTSADFNDPDGSVTDKYVFYNDTFYPTDESYLMSIEWPHDWHDTIDPMTGSTFTKPRIYSHIKFS